MTKKIITWIDLQGRYRVTSPAYNDRLRPAGETEEQCLERTWATIVEKGRYGISIDHSHHYIEDADQRERLVECCGNHFRWGGSHHGPHGDCDARDGAWEMDTDGLPTVNMPKARGVQMDKIRLVRNAELTKLDLPSLRAMETGDTATQATIAVKKQELRDIPQTFDLTTDNDSPEELREKWPEGLPKE